MKSLLLHLLFGAIVGLCVLHAEDPAQIFGEQLFAAKQAGNPLPQFSQAMQKADLEQAYIVQKTYVGLMLENWEKLAGFKGGMVGKASQEFFGIDEPLSAVLFESGFRLSRGKTITIPKAQVPNVGIETEMGFILGKEIKEPLKSPEEAKAVIRAVVPVVELPAGKREVKGKTTAGDLAAVNITSALFIVGEEAELESVNLDDLPVRLWKGDQLVNETNSNEAEKGQWWNVMFQLNHALEQGYTLQPGQLVITGALGTIYKEVPGVFRAEWEGLGTIRFEIK